MATVSSHGLLPKLAFSLYVSFLMFHRSQPFRGHSQRHSYEGAREPTQRAAPVARATSRSSSSFCRDCRATLSFLVELRRRNLDVTINRLLHAKFGHH
uniref:Secreted protein n=1 Tax=Macrostomum lignano TaxID=282301 RepID=A0A1I8FFJ4_9PLAT